ncbi:MAG: hypothetical protein A3F12_06055 [Gammaproteobacteria bacterium RIFCSPHIGHO2_12_FULL_38_14]|nr:MAG: hypothetical protein A3F12_06055 [Gammaproteobacteria bacterium RIFCSPHIGHO2_12_FULL_38_14]
MRAMILAAGRGERMGALTEALPKPLLRVGKYYLIEYALFRLSEAGINEVMINLAYRGEQIKEALGHGSRYGLQIFYTEERERLETGGGILNVLPFFKGQPFLVLSCDVITDFPLSSLPRQPSKLAHIVLVKNPAYHIQGDFALSGDMVTRHAAPKLTFSNIGIYHPELFADYKPGYFRLGHVLNAAADQGQVTGEYYQGVWYNVGTPQDLEEVTSPLEKIQI